MKRYTRRSFLQHSAIGAIAAALPPSLWAGSAKSPLSAFDEDSTAEEVTAGLDLTGRTFAITGANSGLGYETMRVLTMRGAHVIGIARTQEKASDACASVGGKATPAHLDLGVPDSIVSCAETIRGMDVPIDGLICNAGIMALPEPRTTLGFDLQFLTNHIGHFILVTELLDSLTSDARVVVVSSGAHKMAPTVGIQFDDRHGALGDDLTGMLFAFLGTATVEIIGITVVTRVRVPKRPSLVTIVFVIATQQV